VILDAPLDEQDAVALAGMVRERGMGMCFHRPDKLYCELDDRMMATVHDIVGEDGAVQVDDVLQETTVPAKVTVFAERTDLEGLNEDILDQDLYVRTVFSGAIFLEVTRGDVSKGTALTVLSEHLKIPLARTAVIGDQENDLSMFEIAGLTVAMGNAPQIVKNKAHHVAPENDEGGAAWALMNIILPGRSA
jgi:Cof subfamily protein (haloacid dehalogenase superfamily)